MDARFGKISVVAGLVMLTAAVAALAANAGRPGKRGIGPPGWLLEAQPAEGTGEDKGAGLACFDLGGTWLGSQQVGTVTIETWTPLDRFGLRYAQQYELLNLDPTLWGMFPSATRLTVFMGEVERTSLRSLEWQSVAHALDAASGIVYTLLMRGTATLLGCDRIAFSGTFAVYAPGQDPFTEEPAYGCFPLSRGTSTRMGVWRGCPMP